MQNGLQLNPNKSEALIVGMSPQLKQVMLVVPSVTVTDIDLQVAEQMKVLGVILDQRLTFEKHAISVVMSCSYHSQSIRHIQHLLMLDLAQTLACSLIPSRIDYCNAVAWCPSHDDLQDAASAEQCGSNCTSGMKRIQCRATASHAALATVKQRTYNCVQNLWLSGTPLLARPSRKTDFAARGFRHSVPAVWNSLPKTVLDSSSLTVFKSRLKSHLFHLAYSDRQ